MRSMTLIYQTSGHHEKWAYAHFYAQIDICHFGREGRNESHARSQHEESN